VAHPKTSIARTKTKVEDDLRDSNNLISCFKAQHINRVLDGALDVSLSFPFKVDQIKSHTH
jgi:hypothetical protein